jgi:hypothetical protein
MSNRKSNGFNEQGHRQAAELHNLAAHAHHVAAEEHGKKDYLTGQESSRQAREHSETAHQQTAQIHSAAKHEELSNLAHELWQSRGCPEGTPDEDWFRANNQLLAAR